MNPPLEVFMIGGNITATSVKQQPMESETTHDCAQLFLTSTTKKVYLNVCPFKTTTVKNDTFVPLNCHYSNQFPNLFLKPVFISFIYLIFSSPFIPFVPSSILKPVLQKCL